MKIDKSFEFEIIYDVLLTLLLARILQPRPLKDNNVSGEFPSKKLTKLQSIYELIWFISLFSRIEGMPSHQKKRSFSTVCMSLTTCTNSSLLAADKNQLDCLDLKFKCTRLKVGGKTVSNNFPANCMDWINVWTVYMQQTESLNFDSNASDAIRSPTGFSSRSRFDSVAESCVSRPVANWTSLHSIVR